MVNAETQAEIRRLFHVEHMKVYAISNFLQVSRDVVRRVLSLQRFSPEAAGITRPGKLTPYLSLIDDIITKHPKIRATRLKTLLKERGYEGSISLLRDALRQGLRPKPRRAYQVLHSFPGEQAQVDWGSFGKIKIGNAERSLSCFVMVLSWSRGMYARFMLDQTTSSFIAAHQEAFVYLGGVARQIRYDNLRSVVLSRDGRAVSFNDNFLEFAGNCGFLPSACNPYSGHEKGKVERTIRFIRDSFFACRNYQDLSDLNRQLLAWIETTAMTRRWPEDHSKMILDQWTDEKPKLLPLPVHWSPCERREDVRIGKTPYARFDLNDYSVPWRFAGKTLTVWASEHRVKIFDGTTELANHERAYGRQQRLTDDRHLDGLYEQTPGAGFLQSRERLMQMIPESAAYLDLAYQHQGRTSRAVEVIDKLLTKYGKGPVAEAMQKAVELGRHDSWFLRTATQTFHRNQGSPKALPLYLPDRAAVRNLRVETRDLTRYDQLSTESTINKDLQP
jgi:transposase